jgi:multidrug efflux pump subunit AcrB
MIFETSRQARFMIPMAISLGFGILFATAITLVLVPCLYLAVEDLKRYFTRPSQDDIKKIIC